MSFDYFSDASFTSFGEQLEDSKKKSKYKVVNGVSRPIATEKIRVQNYIPPEKRKSTAQKKLEKTWIGQTPTTQIRTEIDKSRKTYPKYFEKYGTFNYEYLNNKGKQPWENDSVQIIKQPHKTKETRENIVPVTYKDKTLYYEYRKDPEEYNDMFIADAPGYDRLEGTKPNVSKNANKPSAGSRDFRPTLAQMKDTYGQPNYANPGFYEPPRQRTLGDTGGYTIVGDKKVYETNPSLSTLETRKANAYVDFKKANNISPTTQLTEAQKLKAFNPIYIKSVSTAEQSARSRGAGDTLKAQIGALDKLARGGVKVNTDIFTPSSSLGGKSASSVLKATTPTGEKGILQKQFSTNIKMISAGIPLGNKEARAAIEASSVASDARLSKISKAKVASAVSSFNADPNVGEANRILRELGSLDPEPIKIVVNRRRRGRWDTNIVGGDPASVINQYYTNKNIYEFGLANTDIKPDYDINMNISSVQAEKDRLMGSGERVVIDSRRGRPQGFIQTGPAQQETRMESYTGSRGNTKYAYATYDVLPGVVLNPTAYQRVMELNSIIDSTGTKGIYRYADKVRAVGQQRKSVLDQYIDPIEGEDAVFAYATFKESDIGEIKKYSDDLRKLSGDYDANLDVIQQGIAKVQTARGKAPVERAVAPKYRTAKSGYDVIETREKPFVDVINDTMSTLSGVSEKVSGKQKQVEIKENISRNFYDLMNQGLLSGITPYDLNPQGTTTRKEQISTISTGLGEIQSKIDTVQSELSKAQSKLKPVPAPVIGYPNARRFYIKGRLYVDWNGPVVSNQDEINKASEYNTQFAPEINEITSRMSALTTEKSQLETEKARLEHIQKNNPMGYAVQDVIKGIETNLPTMAPNNIEKLQSFKTTLEQQRDIFGQDLIGGDTVVDLGSASFGGGGRKVRYHGHDASGVLTIPKEFVPKSGKVILEANVSYTPAKGYAGAEVFGYNVVGTQRIKVEVPVDENGNIQISGRTYGHMYAAPFTMSDIKIRDPERSTVHADLSKLMTEQAQLQSKITSTQGKKSFYDTAQSFLLGGTDILTDDTGNTVAQYTSGKLNILDPTKFGDLYGTIDSDVFNATRIIGAPLSALETRKQSLLKQKQQNGDVTIDTQLLQIDDAARFLTSNIPELKIGDKVVAKRSQTGKISVLDKEAISSIGFSIPESLLNPVIEDKTTRISALESTVAQKEAKQKELIAELKTVQKERIKENAVAKQVQIDQLLQKRVISRRDAAKMKQDINNDVIVQNNVIDGVDDSVPIPDITEFDDDLKSEAQRILESTGKIVTDIKRGNQRSQLRQVTRSRTPQASTIGSVLRLGQTVPRPSDDRPPQQSTTLGASLTSGSVMDA